MTAASCPFCTIEASRIFHAGDMVLGVWDACPVSPGHALLIPRRHIATWFDATHQERAELAETVGIARCAIERRHQPDGFNIGVNVGAAAGQTIPHLHVHVIPRYAGDVPNPRGGVRYVIPAHANYPASSERDAPLTRDAGGVLATSSILAGMTGDSQRYARRLAMG